MVQNISNKLLRLPPDLYTKMPDRFSNVSEQIYRGGEPSEDDLRLMSDIYGIKTIVSLDGNIGGQIAPTVEEIGMEHIVIPIGGRGSISLINYLKNNIASILSTKQPIYVHCRHGSDRTGMAVAFYRMQNEGMSPEDAINEAKAFGFGDKLDPDTEGLYKGAIIGAEDMSDAFDADVVSGTRDQGSNPPAYSPRQSFSAPDDIPYDGPDESLSDPPPAFKDPYAFITSRPPSDDQEARRGNLKKVLMETMTELESVPQVGGRDGGSIPIGVGPTETGGGVLNL